MADVRHGPRVVTIEADALASVEAHAHRERPAECCGILIGQSGEGRVTSITAARPAINLSPDSRRFELDPQAHVQAIRETRGSRFEVVGFYHSHPHSAPFPSATDLAESTYPAAVHLITGWSDGAEAPITRAFRLDASGYDELPLMVSSRIRGRLA